MKARAIIELDEMPINCFKRSVRVGCKPICPLEYLCRNPKQQHRYSNEFQDGCPLREVPEWTEEDSFYLNHISFTEKELAVINKLCQLAGVEVEM